MEEKLTADKKRKLINDFLHKVMQENPSFYYSPTADIAREIHNKVKFEISRMAIDDQVLLKQLTVRDIEVILSIKS